MNKSIVHTKTVEEGVYRSTDIEYEKIYGQVKTICDSEYALKDVSGNMYEALEWTIFFKFDEKNNEIEVDRYDGNGVLQSKSLFSYNSSNKIERQYFYKPASTLKYTYEYTYDKNGKFTDYSLYSGNTDKNPVAEYTDSFDSKGNVVQECLFENGKPSLKTFEIVHDERGNKIAGRVTNFLGTSDDHFKYDDSDNQIERISTSYDKSVADTVRNLYSRKDVSGNWLRKRSYKNGVLVKGTCRKIAYY